MKYVNVRTGITVEYDGDISGKDWEKIIVPKLVEAPDEEANESSNEEANADHIEIENIEDSKPEEGKIIHEDKNKKTKQTVKKGKTVIKP